MKYLVGLVVALALGVTACTRDGIQAGEGRLVFDDARVEVAGPEGAYRPVTDDVTLQRGDRVRVRSGEATLRLAGDASVLLRRGTSLRLDRAVSVLRGDVVALPGDEPLTLGVLESRVVATNGAVRVRSGLSVTAGVYEGAARLVTGGRSLDVPAYREATITAYGVVPTRPDPLRYKDDDSWDRRWLGAAIEITKDLEARSRGVSEQLRPGEGRTLGFFRLLLPALERERGFESCDAALARAPGETLVGTGIALQARGRTFLDRCQDVFTFRDEGATWGLVALDQRIVELRSIRQILADAVGRVPVSATYASPPPSPVVEGPPAPVTESASPPGSSAPSAAAPATPGAPAAPAAADDDPPPPTAGLPLPPLTSPPDEQPGLLEPLVDPVEDTLGGLLGALLG